MTFAEQMRQQGRQQGIEQGRQQGIEQGRQQGIEQGIEQGERGLLLRQLRKRFGAEVGAGLKQQIAAASGEQIEIWAERVLTAATLGALLAD